SMKCAYSIFSAISEATPSASKPRAASDLPNSLRSSHAGDDCLATFSQTFPSTTTCGPSPVGGQMSLLADLLASEPALHRPWMADARGKLCGPKCCASGSTPAQNGLSWNSRPATRNGKPKSRKVWRELATTQPDLNFRLAILVRRIFAGEC